MTVKVIVPLAVVIIATLTYIVGSRTSGGSVTRSRPSDQTYGLIKRQLGMEATDLDVVDAAMRKNKMRARITDGRETNK